MFFPMTPIRACGSTALQVRLLGRQALQVLPVPLVLQVRPAQLERLVQMATPDLQDRPAQLVNRDQPDRPAPLDQSARPDLQAQMAQRAT